MTAERGADGARLFFALWPEARLQSALAGLAADIQAQCGGRATPSEKIHITLFYVGDIDRERVPALKAIAAAVAVSRFELDLNRIGYWRQNRIVWAGARDCPEALAALAQQLQQRLLVEGVQAEDRPYVPHVTLVRNAQRFPQRKDVGPLTWEVREFALVESAPAGAGVRYDVVARWPLLTRHC
jgi:2'-5' RNA ligase